MNTYKYENNELIDCDEKRYEDIKRLIDEFNSAERVERRHCLYDLLRNIDVSVDEEYLQNVIAALEFKSNQSKAEKHYF